MCGINNDDNNKMNNVDKNPIARYSCTYVDPVVFTAPSKYNVNISKRCMASKTKLNSNCILNTHQINNVRFN